ncbi:conserved hypothetical protein [Hyella patelloides LEGE 07179]|uniref:Abortive infection protein-like C-terminal domain-containing protein n=1 Tax=Hyella patelloides LEGE 07179 TaxID=945734 RepID=A0A563VYN0_9CYAN|nr:abortive infection family protein [Hyella patelloides]VEP16564.1 conserved hypothetical protein [Hyella patelloides LEGE 07179]
MKISEHSISAIGSIITGDKELSPYRSGSDLVNFFNQFGSEDTYGSGFPSRWKYAEDKLREFNDKPIMKDIILATVDPRDFIENRQDLENVIKHINSFLEFDGYKIEPNRKGGKIFDLNSSQIDLENPYSNSKQVTHTFLQEQIEKCERKLAEDDFDGAITNARSLLEAVLISIESKLDFNRPDYDGNLPKLYKRVQKHLNLCPGQEELADCLRQILSGLTSIISGLASMRNTMSDSHAIRYKPSEHHARLAVNASKTLSNFIFDTNKYQNK